MSIQQINDSITQPAAYNGLAVIPSKRIHRDIVDGLLTEPETQSVKSGGQTYRSEKSLRETLVHPSTLLAIKTRLLFPHKKDSMQSLLHLQNLKKHETFPISIQTFDDLNAAKKGGLLNLAVILSPENYETTGASSSEQLNVYLQRRDAWLCLDPLYQLQRSFTDGRVSPFRDFEKVINELILRTRTINLSLGRTDLGDSQTKINELADLYFDTNNTEVVANLTFIRKSMDRLSNSIPVVLQIPYTAIMSVLDKSSVTIVDIRNFHTKVLKKVRGVFGD